MYTIIVTILPSLYGGYMYTIIVTILLALYGGYMYTIIVTRYYWHCMGAACTLL